MIVNPYSYDAQALIGPNTGMNLSFNVLKAMMVEGDVPITDVASDGDSIGCVYDQTINALILRQGTSGARPVLGSDGTRNSFATFDGTNDFLPVLTSLSFFNTFWQAVPKGTFLIWFKMNGGDGVTQFIIGNTNLTTVAGLQIFRANTNKILCRGGDGTLRWTVTSTDDITTADGWVGLICSINGTGASAGRLILMDSSGTIFNDQTFSVAAGSTVNAQSNIFIGARNDSTLFLNGSISSIIVENFPVTDSLIDQFKAHNPARVSGEFEPIAQWLLDMNNPAYIFSDTSGASTAVNNDPVRIVRNSIIGNFNTTPAHGALRRQLTNLISTATSPTFKTNILNGRSALLFDGSNDNLTSTDAPTEMFEERGGKHTSFYVVQNLDATFGSHILMGETYIVVTGSGYTTGGLTSPYWVHHVSPSGSGISGEFGGGDTPKIIAVVRNGSSWSGWNGDKVKTTNTNSSPMYYTNMGANFSSLPDWDYDGYMFYFKKYNGVMTDAQVEAEIDRLKAEYGL